MIQPHQLHHETASIFTSDPDPSPELEACRTPIPIPMADGGNGGTGGGGAPGAHEFRWKLFFRRTLNLYAARMLASSPPPPPLLPTVPELLPMELIPPRLTCDAEVWTERPPGVRGAGANSECGEGEVEALVGEARA